MAVLLLLASAAFGNTYRVRNTKDSGQYSLRWAIDQANGHVGRDTIVFASRTAGEVIVLSSPLPNLTDNRTVIRGDIDGDGDPDVAINGKSILVGNGLTISGNNCVISGLAIASFPKMGIAVADSTGCRILGCHVGVNLAGSKRRSSSFPNIDLFNASACQIGGTAAGQRNIIAGGDGTEGSCGIRLVGTEGTQVVNNYIGVARDGKTVFGGEGTGVEILPAPGDPSTGNTIGGSRALGQGNVFGGLDYGVFISAGFDNVIAGNNFGLAADGDTALPLSAACVLLRHGSQRNLIGGSAADVRNVCAGNAQAAVGVIDSGTQDNKVQGNYFGTNVGGDKQRRLAAGVVIELGAGAQVIGGNTAARGNYFALKSTSKQYGVYLDRAGDGTLVRHNHFGVRPAGTAGLNYDTAVYVRNVKAEVTDNKIVKASVGVMVLEASGHARVLRNLFRSCYIAVNIAPTARAMLGNLGNSSTTDDGGNVFRPSNTWTIDNESPYRIKAEGNDFGTTSRSEIDAKILDRRDNPSCGRVDFNPLEGGVIPSGEAVPLTVASATALPTRGGGAEIAFSLSAAADVTVTILNIAGRPVATVARELATDAGTKRLVWSGQTTQGTRAPSGTYLVRVTAHSSDGEHVQAVTRVRIER